MQRKRVYAVSVTVTVIILIFALTSCGQSYREDDNSSNEPSNISTEDYAFLKDQFVRFSGIYNGLNNSPGTGEDVRTAYIACQDVLDDIYRHDVSNNAEQLKNLLYEGINNQCNGFGCFSNEAICGSQKEATRLLYSGNRILKQFEDKMNSITVN